ncbi:MAG TPA: mechanosensitive ion channel family protein [Afifellaceae bacterium]|nr:mechanosensitive ion channel family protein [Afifellaceae bacterium]
MTAAFAQERPPGPAPPLEIETDPGAAIERVEAWIDGFFRLLPNLAVALFVLLLFVLLAWVAKLAFRRWARRRGRPNLGEVLGGLLRWAVIVLGVLLALTIILPTLQPGDLLAGLGIGSVAIGFAFKDILQNWLAGLLILIRQPFQIGDQIVVTGYEGTVVRIDTRTTDIRTYDGRRVLVPNSEVYTNAVTVNTAYDKRRSEYDVGIGYGDDIPAACSVLLQAVNGAEGVESEPAPDVIPWSIDSSWVRLRVRWWTHSRWADVVEVQGRVIRSMKEALDEAGIDMPFETSVQLWHDQSEEWDGVRGRQREGWPKPVEGDPPRPAREALSGPEQALGQRKPGQSPGT